MEIKGRLVESRLIRRDNRFRVTVEMDGSPVWAHLSNSGRLGELLVPGRRLVLVTRPGAHRKTGYDVHLVQFEGHWVSMDAQLPNDLVAEALREGRLAPLAGYPTVRREVSFGHSRFDFLLEAPDQRPFLIEVKSITLVIDGLGCFPDAVTARGRKHVQELAAAVHSGHRGAVVFCIQREDAVGMRPHDESDPDFGDALREAALQGVEVYAYRCHVEPGRVQITQPVPVHLKTDY